MKTKIIRDRELYKGMINFVKTFNYFDRKDLVFMASGCEFELNLKACPTQTLRDFVKTRILKEVFHRAYC